MIDMSKQEVSHIIIRLNRNEGFGLVWSLKSLTWSFNIWKVVTYIEHNSCFSELLDSGQIFVLFCLSELFDLEQ